MTVVPLEALPLGFRFRPTDEELINHYLKRKINGRIRSDVEVIPEIDVCKCEPWDLPDKSLIRSFDPEWFFFSPKDRKYPKGHRSNRATEAGYWKATGNDRTIRSKAHAGSGIIGMKKTLVFHQGRAPKGVRTHWIMHEYRTTEPEFESGEQGGYVLYRLFRKTEEKSPSSNGDEIEKGGLSPTPTKSSPDGTQNEGDGLEEIDIPIRLTPISQISPVSDMQEQPLSTTIEKQPSGITRWLADKADCSTLKPENNSDKHMALDVKSDHNSKGGTVVDPLLEALERFCDPQNDPIDAAEFPNVSSPMLPYSDHPFFGNTDQESHMGFGQPDYVEQDSLNEFLNSILSNQEYYPETSNVQQTSTTEAMHSRSSSELDTEEGLMQGAIGFGSPGWCYADTSTFGFPEFNDGGLYQSSSLLPCDSTGPDVNSVDSGADSLQELFNSVDESTGKKNISRNGVGLDGTGVELRTRSNQHPSVGHLSTTQGSAKRRIIFMSSVRAAATSSTVCGSGSDKENYQDTEAAVEVGESEYSSTENGLGSDSSDKEDLQSSTEVEENEELDDIAKERGTSELCLGPCKHEDAAICGNVIAIPEADEVSNSAISHASELLALGDTDEASRSGTPHESKPLALTETGRGCHSETVSDSQPIALSADTEEASRAEISDESEPKLMLRTKPTNEIVESERVKGPALVLRRPSSNKVVGYMDMVFLLVILVLICVGVWSWGRSQSVCLADESI